MAQRTKEQQKRLDRARKEYEFTKQYDSTVGSARAAAKEGKPAMGALSAAERPKKKISVSDEHMYFARKDPGSWDASDKKAWAASQRKYRSQKKQR